MFSILKSEKKCWPSTPALNFVLNFGIMIQISTSRM